MSVTSLEIRREDGTTLYIERHDAELVYDFIHQKIHKDYLRYMLKNLFGEYSDIHDKNAMIDELLNDELFDVYWDIYEKCIGEIGESECFDRACEACNDSIEAIVEHYRQKY